MRVNFAAVFMAFSNVERDMVLMHVSGATRYPVCESLTPTIFDSCVAFLLPQHHHPPTPLPPNSDHCI